MSLSALESTVNTAFDARDDISTATKGEVRDAVDGQEFLVGLRRRLWLEFGGDDVEHVLEMLSEAEPRQHGVGMAARAVGEDQLAARKTFERQAERRVRLERRMIDLMHEIEEVVRRHAMLGHQPAHRGAVALVIVLLQPECLIVGDLEEVGDIVADALVHLRPEIDVMRVKRVVEVEYPGLDMVEGARRKVG